MKIKADWLEFPILYFQGRRKPYAHIAIYDAHTLTDAKWDFQRHISPLSLNVLNKNIKHSFSYTQEYVFNVKGNVP